MTLKQYFSRPDTPKILCTCGHEQRLHGNRGKDDCLQTVEGFQFCSCKQFKLEHKPSKHSGLGRKPVSETAMSHAERQRKYRERISSRSLDTHDIEK